MSNLNSFNVCPRCSTPNPLVAKYCFQCGTQLKIPDTPIVCGKCKTVNTGRSSYCKACGAKLVGAGVTKICPRCNNTVDANNQMCNKCGYAFASAGTVFPALAQVQEEPERKARKKQQTQVEAYPSSYTSQAYTERASLEQPKVKKGSAAGSLIGVFTLILALAAAYFILMPQQIAIPNWAFPLLNGVNLGGFAYIFGVFTSAAVLTTMDYLLLAIIALTLLMALIEAIIGLIQLFSGRRLKKGKWWLFVVGLIVAILTGVANMCQYSTALVRGMQDGFLKNVVQWFANLNGATADNVLKTAVGNVNIGIVFNVQCAYVLVAWVLSLLFKLRRGSSDLGDIRVVGR